MADNEKKVSVQVHGAGTLWRQGDVYVQRVEKIPAGAKPKKGATLAEGEATGHAHKAADPSDIRLFEKGGVLYLEVLSEEAEIVHEEHKTIRLPKGEYRAWQQREYTPTRIRTVRD